MKRFFAFCFAATLLAGCSQDETLNADLEKFDSVAIGFDAYRQNGTRAASTTLDGYAHYNFGVWASKVTPGNANAQTVMEHYLVGYSDGVSKGYDKTGGSTWSETGAGTATDHKSFWFYENLGKSQYTYEGAAGFYKASQTAYMSANESQYLRYWDLAFTNTNFFCYAPYNATGVTCDLKTDGSAVMTFAGTTLSDRYDNPVNTAYAAASYDRSLNEFMYAGVQATNSALSDITVPFKHMGSQLFIRFYEDIPNYKVELLDLSADGGQMATASTADQKVGIQATPAIAPAAGSATYTKGSYYTTTGAVITFGTDASANFAIASEGGTTTQQNLMFQLPSATASYPTVNVPTDLAANLTEYAGLGTTKHSLMPEKVATGTQTYSWSPTVYYPVAQPAGQQNGFTFHVTYRIIAEDNKEVITVHNATVFVPSDYTTWETNTRYIYTFRITLQSSGSTSPSDEIDPTEPTPALINTIYPIVFDHCTVEDYIPAESEHPIN